MTITIDLNSVPFQCWFYAAGLLYLLISYLWLGPILCRRHVARSSKFEREFAEMDAVLMWLGSPFIVVWYLAFTCFLHPVACRIIFGRPQ